MGIGINFYEKLKGLCSQFQNFEIELVLDFF